MKLLKLSCVVWLAVFVGGSLSGAEVERADVVVYGGSASGIIASVKAARLGKSVVLIEAGKDLGGLTAGGLGMTDLGRRETVGGLSREFYKRIYNEYLKGENWKVESRGDYCEGVKRMGQRPDDAAKMMFMFEPHVASRVFDEMLREAKVRVVMGERLDLKNGVVMEGKRITRIRMESGRIFEGKVFVDATYEGDLMAKAGVSYTTGREGNSQYGETYNGVLASEREDGSGKGALEFPRISPYVVEGDPSSGLLPLVEPKPPGKKGDADPVRQQAYNFRVCLTDVPENRLAIEKPEGYNPLSYELMARWIRELQRSEPMKPFHGARRGLVNLRGENKELGISFHRMPNRKTDSNIGSEFGSDYLGMSWDWAEGDYALREKRWQEHKTYILGLIWFLGNDERVPEAVRTEMKRWGLPKDEFANTGHWPFQLYVREARRMVSDYVMTEHDWRGARKAEDSVALASYAADSHGVTLFVNEKGVLCREKGFYTKSEVFPVSYRAIRPKVGECENLLVSQCVSSSHAAFGPIRMEPVFMMLGHAAGAAAALSVERNCSVQELPYAILQERLLKDGMVLEFLKKK